MSKEKFSFELLSTNNYARRGKIKTPRGEVDTPAFMPVGTQGTVKAVFLDDLVKTGAQIILSNTYHLMLRPGVKILEKFDGLHNFMNCSLPILTDSGGFQIMSLAKLTKIDRDKGATFRSHIDGKKYILSPEESIKIQKSINSDIMMVLDECPKLSNDKKKIEQSLILSIEWAQRSKNEFGKNDKKALFGIIQGGMFDDLRIKSLKELIKINFDGYALGGLAVGESQKQMFSMIDVLKNELPVNKPRYLMGVGTPSDILGAVKRGIDMFDCVLPTRSGRTGLAFTWKGRINIRNSKYKNDKSPLDNDNQIKQINNYSKAYLNHLFSTNEILASMLLTLHNLSFYQELMKSIRVSIENGTFDHFYDKFINKI